MPLPTIPSGNVNSGLATGFNVANSCRFNDGDSAFLSKTLGTGTNTTKLTVSVWIKRSTLGTEQQIFETWNDNNNRFDILFKSSTDQLEIQNTLSGSTTINLKTNRVFRDPSAWMNIVVIVDSTQSTASNRVKLYINGTQETSFATETYLNEDANLALGTSSYTNFIGKYSSSGGNFFDGYMCEVVYLDGTAASIGDLGEFDEDSPRIWKPKDVSGLTFGTNGFYLDFEDSSNLGNDANGGTDLTEVNLAATDSSTDTPTNNFCTMNPLNAYYDVCTLSEGNTKYDGNSAVGQYTFTPATMGFSKGKWYWEMKFGSSDTDNWGGIGITSANSTGTTNYLGGSANAYAYYGRTLSGGLGVTYTNNTQTNQGLPFEDGDIIMVAVDCDNLAIYFGKNGTWLNNSSSVTGVPTSGSSKTGAFFSITAPSSTTDGFYFPASGTYSGSQVYPQFLNFGSPAYAISSGNADANGYGNFEYTVPSGYLALCTKNLGSDGG